MCRLKSKRGLVIKLNSSNSGLIKAGLENLRSSLVGQLSTVPKGEFILKATLCGANNIPRLLIADARLFRSQEQEFSEAQQPFNGLPVSGH
jgi:hypothetical protein